MGEAAGRSALSLGAVCPKGAARYNASPLAGVHSAETNSALGSVTMGAMRCFLGFEQRPATAPATAGGPTGTDGLPVGRLCDARPGKPRPGPAAVKVAASGIATLPLLVRRQVEGERASIGVAVWHRAERTAVMGPAFRMAGSASLAARHRHGGMCVGCRGAGIRVAPDAAHRMDCVARRAAGWCSSTPPRSGAS